MNNSTKVQRAICCWTCGRYLSIVGVSIVSIVTFCIFILHQPHRYYKNFTIHNASINQYQHHERILYNNMGNKVANALQRDHHIDDLRTSWGSNDLVLRKQVTHLSSASNSYGIVPITSNQRTNRMGKGKGHVNNGKGKGYGKGKGEGYSKGKGKGYSKGKGGKGYNQLESNSMCGGKGNSKSKTRIRSKSKKSKSKRMSKSSNHSGKGKGNSIRQNIIGKGKGDNSLINKINEGRNSSGKGSKSKGGKGYDSSGHGKGGKGYSNLSDDDNDDDFYGNDECFDEDLTPFFAPTIPMMIPVSVAPPESNDPVSVPVTTLTPIISTSAPIASTIAPVTTTTTIAPSMTTMTSTGPTPERGLVSVRVSNWYIAFRAPDAITRAPTREEYDMIAESTRIYIEMYFQNYFTTNMFNNILYVRTDIVLATASYGLDVPSFVPQPSIVDNGRVNIYVQFRFVEFFYVDTSTPIPDEMQSYTLVEDAIAYMESMYIVEVPQPLTGTPFESTIDIIFGMVP